MWFLQEALSGAEGRKILPCAEHVQAESMEEEMMAVGKWEARFKVKDLLCAEDVLPHQSQALAAEIARRLRVSTVFPPLVRHELVVRFEDVEDQEDFNTALGYLYDAADDDNVWCE